jgi:hypothetical protein
MYCFVLTFWKVLVPVMVLQHFFVIVAKAKAQVGRNCAS